MERNRLVKPCLCCGGRRTLLSVRQYSESSCFCKCSACGVTDEGGAERFVQAKAEGKLHTLAESSKERLWARKPVTGN